ncbi:transcriptional regulator [Candidatus Thiomargarita nelsonii]|uniref:Transcriptional regulator n=1 Tax=Candidatus Thiomargarita nelsonii TaxID=1003181 RepID=A0A176S1Q5_9GAMM|nr:transcriptional regulator [Candidatus Thiomargarita nelsonii]
MLSLNLHTPREIQLILSQRVKRLRLINEWTQAELAERAGITLVSLKRFESTGKISLERLSLIALALGRLNELMQLFEEPEIMTLSDIKKLTKKRQRGKRKSMGD